MRIDPANKFQSFILDEHELQTAKAVSPYFYAFLHNLIAEKACMVVEYRYEGDFEINSPSAVMEHEKLKAQLDALEDLMMELTPPVEQPQDSSESTS